MMSSRRPGQLDARLGRALVAGALAMAAEALAMVVGVVAAGMAVVLRAPPLAGGDAAAGRAEAAVEGSTAVVAVDRVEGDAGLAVAVA